MKRHLNLQFWSIVKGIYAKTVKLKKSVLCPKEGVRLLNQRSCYTSSLLYQSRTYTPGQDCDIRNNIRGSRGKLTVAICMLNVDCERQMSSRAPSCQLYSWWIKFLQIRHLRPSNYLESSPRNKLTPSLGEDLTSIPGDLKSGWPSSNSSNAALDHSISGKSYFWNKLLS